MFAAIASLEPVKTRIIDFQTQRESMQMRMYQNDPTEGCRTSLGKIGVNLLV